jgi:drug/metabolite transporter (DMT)-like permease
MLIIILEKYSYTNERNGKELSMKNVKGIRMTSQSSLVVSRPDFNVLIYFLVFILIMGGSPVAMRIGYSQLAPFWLGFLRFGLGAIVFWILVAIKRLRVPQGRAVLGPILYGILGIGISFVFLAWGLVKTPASLAAIFLALVPMMTVILSSVQGVEPLTTRGIFGSALTVVGTIIAVGAASSSNEISFIHIGALILGTAFLAEGGIVVKRYPPNSPITTNAVAMLVGAIILVIASLIAGESRVIPSQSTTWIALGYLVFFVSGVAFLLYLEVLNKWTASGTSYGFVIIPFVTIVISAFLIREQISPNFLIGAAVVISGVIIGALLPQKVKMTRECLTC